MSRYHEVYAAWKKDPEAFWAEAARDIDWYNLWDKVFDPYAGEYGRWFAGAECNTAYNCLDRHVLRGRGQQKALIYDNPVTSRRRVIPTLSCVMRWQPSVPSCRTWACARATASSSICR